MNIKTLHERQTQDLHVELLWDAGTNRVYVVVRNRVTADVIVVEPDPGSALDAFYHPFAYHAVAERARDAAAA